MGYLSEFVVQIQKKDLRKFLILWEEYMMSDHVDPAEFAQLLKALKDSDFAKPVGQIVETAVPLWQTIENSSMRYEILRLLLDLQTTNSPALADLAQSMLESAHAAHPRFHEFLKLIGLKSRENFQGAISKYDLLVHFKPGNVVYHTGGWATGEILDVSFVREHLTLEFENARGKKDLSFTNAFKTLLPLPPTHFLARRFLNPDLLEKEGREDPTALIKLLLRDLGPKTAKEIKDELCDLVIPEVDWNKWWQNARSKLKKDPLVESPESVKEPFSLRHSERSSIERFEESLRKEQGSEKLILTLYNFLKEHPELLREAAQKASLYEKLLSLTTSLTLTDAQRLQVHSMFSLFFDAEKEAPILHTIVSSSASPANLVLEGDIIALKKRALIAIKDYRSDWVHLFKTLLFTIGNSQLRDYLIKELNRSEHRAELQSAISSLIQDPLRHPELFVWYFQKICDQGEGLPYQNPEGRREFFEVFLTLYCQLEGQSQHRDIQKKMYAMLSGDRYRLVRDLLEGSPLVFAQELLLLASKSHSLTNDMMILRSLTAVVHPSLGRDREDMRHRGQEELWTTEEGYRRVQERIQQIANVEMVDNAREIEAARALGDLRENSEFKFAKEKQRQLQIELRTLSQQLQKARLLTYDDIPENEVGIGTVVTLENVGTGEKACYTVLGPWDADPDQGILALHSKFVEAMVGKKPGETFPFREEKFRVKTIAPYLKRE